jgi:excinuclease ABC subunit A
MEGRLLRIGSFRYPQVASMTIEELIEWVEILPSQLNTEQREIALPILQQLYSKLDKYRKVSLTYLNLDRSVTTLSGGEMQRFRLIAQLNNGLQNMLYILDEPSAGLHRKDVKQLIEVLQDLKEQGNTLLVVEHCREVIESADTIIDIGPGAGIHGGHIIAQGSPTDIRANTDSITGKYLSKSVQKCNVDQKFNNMDQQLPMEELKYLELLGANRNNLKNVDVRFPIGVISVVTGVSGSGKSTLLFDCLYLALMEAIEGSHASNFALNGNTDYFHTDYGRLKGYDSLHSVIYVDQNPIGKTSRSNPATYTGVMDSIRTVFANLKESKDRDYKANHFSFNTKEGQCDHCNGEGTISTKLSFMEDMVTICPICNGKKYRKEILSISYQGKNIYDILSMSVDEAITFFYGHDKILPILETLQEVGLGYIHLGQSSTTLSGGEAQRIKLAKELCSNTAKNTLYLLDEPTTGLHFEDIKHLQCMLRKISEAGNTIIMIEHSSDMIQFADWIVELGPKGGVEGGYLIQEGAN